MTNNSTYVPFSFTRELTVESAIEELKPNSTKDAGIGFYLNLSGDACWRLAVIPMAFDNLYELVETYNRLLSLCCPTRADRLVLTQADAGDLSDNRFYILIHTGNLLSFVQDMCHADLL